jgi:asparagine synthase (glutamine-hydrolysing)
MLAQLVHRGPDDGGVDGNGPCWLGHRRLSIIDLSTDGHQPMRSADKRLAVTFNGEIYNFQTLRQELTALGHVFRTRTDTETLLHAYHQWGTECVQHLRGMFAFAIWDEPRQRLFMARDRLGKKPLFYTFDGHRLAFSSELQALLEVPGLAGEINLDAIDLFLTWGYIPSPWSAFKNIAKLPPAHWATVEVKPDGLHLSLQRYWSLSYLPKWKMPENEAIERLRLEVDEAVRLRLVSDVPLGAFLSGGLDSSIVVALMAQASDKPIKTFSIGFENGTYNELQYARAVAERWSTEHHELIVRPDATLVMPMLARHFGEPFGDDSALATYYLARMTRSAVTVALTGDGGDENFAGYERYLASSLAERWDKIPGSKLVSGVLSQGMPTAGERRHLLTRLGRFLEGLQRPAIERYGHWIGATVGKLPDQAKLRLYDRDLLEVSQRRQAALWFESLFADSENMDVVDACLRADVRAYLPDDLLVKTDITTMAISLEARSPLLDHQLMEFTARLPRQFKLRGRSGKYLLRKAFQPLLPPSITRRRKSGFGLPLSDWLRGELADFTRDLLLSSRALGRGYFQPAAMRDLVDEHLTKRRDHTLQLWNLLMLELWHTEVVDRHLAAR